MRIVLILTGQMERMALADSLCRLFPHATFEIEPPTGTPDDLLPKSFTSSTLPFSAQTKAEGNLDDLVRRLTAAVEPGRKGKGRPTLVVLLEDLELANLHQPQIVQAELRAAITRHLQRLRDDPRRLNDAAQVAMALQQRASFHLMSPMTEAYFFADPDALAAVTPRAAEAKLAPDIDIEQFEAADPDYRVPLPPDARCCKKPNKPTPVPWSGDDRSRHPKKYVQYLNRQVPTDPYCTSYRETHQGATALSALSWSAVLAAHRAPFARALIEDIARALDVPCPVAAADDSPTSFFQPRPSKVLRNL